MGGGDEDEAADPGQRLEEEGLAQAVPTSADPEPVAEPQGSTDAPAPSASPGRLGLGSLAINGSNLENYKP
jgi:hypothetical protein